MADKDVGSSVDGVAESHSAGYSEVVAATSAEVVINHSGGEGSPDRTQRSMKYKMELLSHGGSDPRGRSTSPLSFPRTPYCVEIEGKEVTDGGDVQTPPECSWNDHVIFDSVYQEYPNLHEVVVMNPDVALLFFGRRSRGEGVPYGVAEEIATHLSLRSRFWAGHNVELVASEITVTTGRRRVERLMAELRGLRTRRSVPRPRSEATSTAGESDTDNYLTGAEASPRGGARTPSEMGKGRVRQLAKPKKRGRPRRKQRSPRSSASPSPDPEVGMHSDDSHHSQQQQRSRRDLRHKHTTIASNGYGGRIELPPLTELGQQHVGPYILWRKAVLTHRDSGCRGGTLMAAILASVMHLPGAVDMASIKTVEGILAKVDRSFQITQDFDQLYRELYLMRQGSREPVVNFAGRINDKVSLICLAHPRKIPQDQEDRIKKDRFFGGLRVDIRVRLSFITGGKIDDYDSYTYDQLLVLAVRHEVGEDQPRTFNKHHETAPKARLAMMPVEQGQGEDGATVSVDPLSDTETDQEEDPELCA